MTFGSNFRRLRLRLKESLTDFCKRSGFNAGNISKIERGVISPPRSRDRIYEYAKALQLKKSTNEYKKFVTLSTKTSNTFLIENIKSEENLNLAIELFQLIDSEKTDKYRLNKLIDILHKENNIYVVLNAKESKEPLAVGNGISRLNLLENL